MKLGATYRQSGSTTAEIMVAALRLLKRLCLAFVLFGSLGAAMAQSQKPYPRGIIDLPGAISAKNPIGTITDHPWQNVNVDGLRIRTGWDNTETADGVYNWAQIDECLTLAVTSGKFIGLGMIAGIDAPPWLMGGCTFTDGVTTLDVATLTSSTANFVTEDVGRVIVSAYFPAGTTIVSRISSTVVQTSAAATRTTNTKNPAAFSILACNPEGAAFRVLTAPDSGVMVVPWDPLAKAKWKAFVTALGARYDSNPQLGYMVMTGFCQAGEAYLASVQADIDFFDASAIAAGYVATADLPAGLVAWEATVKEVVDTYMTAFPTTPLLITGARPYGGTQSSAGTKAMNDIFAWGVTTYPGRFGIMNAQLHVTSSTGYYLNAAIYNNRFTEPVGIQFLCSTNSADNVARLSNSPPYGSDPLLSAYDAINNSFTAAVKIGCKFVETYEVDVKNSADQTILATQGAALKSPTPTPTAPSITTQPADKTVTAGRTAKFTVTAAGTAPLTYQWTKNGANISGATKASYITPATTTADNGALFAVVVSNVAGSITSNSATLTVK